MTRAKRPPEFKKKVAIEALKEREPLNVIASKFDVHPVQVSKWKQELLQGASIIFSGASKEKRELKSHKEEIESARGHARDVLLSNLFNQNALLGQGAQLPKKGLVYFITSRF